MRGADRGRGQAAACTAAMLAAIFATAPRQRRLGRGLESAEHAAECAAVDRVIAGLRRSEAAALEWRDVADAQGDDGLRVAVRHGKTNPDGETADVRYVKGRRRPGGPDAARTARRRRPDRSRRRPLRAGRQRAVRGGRPGSPASSPA